MAGNNKFMCPCQQSDNGFGTNGKCLADMKCHADSTGGKSPDSGLSQLGQILGQLMSKLGSGGGSGSGSGSGSSPTTPSTGCTSSYYYTSNSSLIGVDPCAMYQAAPTCTDTTATNYGSSAACTYGNSTASSSAGDLLGDLNGTGGSSSSTGASLTATPSSGSTPLAVAFSVTVLTAGVVPSTIDPGDGSGPQAIAQASCTNSVPTTCTYQQLNYTYASAGTYTATLYDGSNSVLSTATVTVTNPGGATGTQQGGLSQIFQTIGGLLAGSSTTQGPGGVSSSGFPGVLGNILLDQNGATIFAQTVNSANNSETSGFYGSNTFGGQPQSIASQLCQGRPWASNFLADIIPPTFFDSLCQWGGYQVGQLQQTTQPQVTLSQQAQSQTTIQTQTSSSQQQATTTSEAQVEIWAVPSSVPLGVRTSVFWNTQDVTQCTETSPDGSFSDNSLSGAAATVPITKATTFTISCLDVNGSPVTDYVTVEISN